MSIKSRLHRVPSYTPAGIYVGDVPALQIDGKRLRSTARRIVRGLFATYMKRIVPESHDVEVTILDFQRDDSPLHSLEVRDLLSELGKRGAHHQFGKILDVWHASAKDDTESTLWLINLHRAFVFFGFTVPKGG